MSISPNLRISSVDAYISSGMIPKPSASSSSCTVTYMNGTASVSCVDSTSSGYQVILLQDNDPYNLTVVNVRPGEKQTVPVVPSGRYCIMELQIGNELDSRVKYSREFIAEEATLSIIIIAIVLAFPISIIIIALLIIIIGKLYCIDIIMCV